VRGRASFVGGTLSALLAIGVQGCGVPPSLALSPPTVEEARCISTSLTLEGLRPTDHLEADGEGLHSAADLRIEVGGAPVEIERIRSASITFLLAECPEVEVAHDLVLRARGLEHRLEDALLVTTGGGDGDGDGDADLDADGDADLDADGDLDADPDAAPCLEGERRCLAVSVEECSPTGRWLLLEACPAGCHDGEPRCFQLVPSSDVAPEWVAEGTEPFAPTEDFVIDTTAGRVLSEATGLPVASPVVHETAGHLCGSQSVAIRTFGFASIDVPAGITGRIVGDHAVALLAEGPIVLAGVLDARGGVSTCGSPRCAGPGGFAGATGGNPGHDGAGPSGGGGGFGSESLFIGDEAGGGGGGNAGAGGAGGATTRDVHPGGLAGPALMSVGPTMCGGSGGGGGGAGNAWDGSGHQGGGGGGAVQLVSATSIEIAGGGINVGGGGGAPDVYETWDDAGGGGGAGGALLLEAPTITVAASGTIAANGGGGGSGGAITGPGAVGTDALLDDTPATGGVGPQRGGNGSAPTLLDGGSAPPGPDGTGAALLGTVSPSTGTPAVTLDMLLLR